MIKNNKKGWIKIIEAFLAILLMTTIVLVVVNRGDDEKKDSSLEIRETENSILRGIQIDNSFRSAILGTSGEVEWDSGSFPASVKSEIQDKTPSYLECVAKICSPSGLFLIFHGLH